MNENTEQDLLFEKMNPRKECFEEYPNDCKQFKLSGAHACRECPHLECPICKDKGFIMIWTGVDTPPRKGICGHPKHNKVPSFT